MNQIRISCRGLIFHEGRVLLQNIDDRNFWNVPGGGFEFSDKSTTDCVVRETLEETGLEAEVIKLFFVQEYQTEETEQIELFFTLKPLNIENYTEFHKDPDSPETKNRLRWFTLEEVDDIALKPVFLQKKLRELLESNTSLFTQNLLSA